MKLALLFRDFAHWTTGTCYRRALESLGVPFVYVNNNLVLQKQVSLGNFDAAIVVDDGFANQRLHTLPANSAYIGIDFHSGFKEFYLENIGQFKHVYAAQYTKGVKLAEEFGVKSTWLPLAYDDVAMGSDTSPRTSWPLDVCWVASWSTERRLRLRDYVHTWFPHTSFTEIAFREELGRAYRQAKVSLNDFGRQVSGRIAGDDVNQRTFEVMGPGCFLLTPRLEVDDLNLIFSMPEFYMEQWDTLDECLDKMLWYIDHDEQREIIARAGQREVLERHTYKHRIKQVLKDLEG